MSVTGIYAMANQAADDNQKTHGQALLSMHNTFLDALRHREQDIVQFLGILGPALGGFVWLLGSDLEKNPLRFAAGTYGVLLVLLMGAFYSLALGYNYRYLTLQLAKLEADDTLDLRKSILEHWPRRVVDFERKSRWGFIPWSTPPGIIKVFWVAFLLCIVGVTISASLVEFGLSQAGPAAGASTQPATAGVTTQPGNPLSKNVVSMKAAIPYVGAVIFLIALGGPVSVGGKMIAACRKETEWKARDRAEEDKGGGRTNMPGELEERATLFRSLATFGLLAGIVLCLGIPILFTSLPGLSQVLQHWIIGIAEITGVLVMGSVVVIFWRRFAPKHDRGGK